MIEKAHDDEKWHWATDGEVEDKRVVAVGDTILYRPKHAKTRSILDERALDYGDPVTNHARIARLWSAYLGVHITPEQVALCMVLVKISRLAHTPGHADSLLDAGGYIDIARQIAKRHATEQGE